ncbi:MAG: 16S rRNA (guanine(966)-N(2))-methyltransferase RsmD [Microbacteriaceae bacterium]
MTRIIAGAAGSITLNVPDHGTRPTSDRVREAMFSALEARNAIDYARVVDLYAGSGALGLEALSRGADSVVLVEKNPLAAKVASSNAKRVAEASDVEPSAVEVVARPVARYLESAPEASADLIFIDPPYDLSQSELEADLASLLRICAPSALIVIERSSRSEDCCLPAPFKELGCKKYGETVLWWARGPR